MSIPYRTRRTLKRIVLVALVVILSAALIWGCWMVWLSRYIIYTRDGAKLDFTLSQPVASGEVAVPPEPEDPISIYYNEGSDQIVTEEDLTRLSGYYLDISDLADVDALISRLQVLPAGTAVLLDVKDTKGNFYYSSNVSSARSTSVDTQAVDTLLDFLSGSALYTIARLPGLRDYNYGLNHVSDGIYHTSQFYLWQDTEGCYWLNPQSQGTMRYLVKIANELKGLGFDEVVFYDFSVPDSENIYFDGDKTEAITAAAKTLMTSCSGDSFTVSFEGSVSFPLPEGRSRLYLKNADASGAQALAEASGLTDPSVYLVFLTQVADTRFDEYGVLRPLSSAHY